MANWLTDVLGIASIGGVCPFLGDEAQVQASRLESQSRQLYAQAWFDRAWLQMPSGVARVYQGVPEKKVAEHRPTKCTQCASQSEDTFRLNKDNNYTCNYCGSVHG